MELTPENVIEKIEKLLGVIHLEYIDEATDLIREYGEQQREKGYDAGYDSRAREQEY